MLLRAILSLLTTAGLMWLVRAQIRAACIDGFATVEQKIPRWGVPSGQEVRSVLTLDRHYAMMFDLVVIAPMTGLIIFLCGKQWNEWGMVMAAMMSVAIILFCMFKLWIGGNEAHVHDGKVTAAGYYHGMFATIGLWAFLMALVFTPLPDPVLLLVLCVVVPAFFFVGTHMYLGMVNYCNAAWTYKDKPLRDPAGWTILVIATITTWWRTALLILPSFWDQYR